MQQDPFYALNEVFLFFAALESCFIERISEITPTIYISWQNLEAREDEVH